MLIEASMLLFEHWVTNWVPSTWKIETSATGELDAAMFAASAGTFYLTDSSDPSHAQHIVQYAGIGLTISKGGIPFFLSGSYSTTDMPGGGVGNIGMKPGKGSLSLSDFAGSGCIISGAFLPPAMAVNPSAPMMGWSGSILFFGAPPLLTDAIGLAFGRQKMLPGVGATWLPCIFRTIVGEPERTWTPSAPAPRS